MGSMLTGMAKQEMQKQTTLTWLLAIIISLTTNSGRLVVSAQASLLLQA